jgi:hypothetical protein
MRTRLGNKPTKVRYIPVWDCPNCKRELPLTFSDTWVNPVTGDEFAICYCPGCDVVPEDESKIKGYASVKWLEERGWQKE